ncbi:hypothetical protein StoSoilA2_02140 [Arthrobacter sp. StoSoilA2]|uniref:hypothetical protein n=1 Tax=unclassified Arthrobacter TaxID=235627 RepID=UPI001CC4CCA1|nr:MULTISPECIES: hypothetical protein [unclassified Arthrobacter]MDR6688857.1 hypothetical protein [Arthrobacter sp. 1088]BCW34158.1 hypothetical protein StoSoilA2_02140 [Arthrobacter sp. StoSoilA2]BCW51866.1 hypothetical protein StoSoilB13_42080 [Arthrobacter sp. StoSoilB13]
MADDIHERIGFREIDEHGNAVRAVNPHAPEAPERARRRVLVNPFVAALWVLDAGLAWFCIWAFDSVAAMTGPTATSPPSQVNFMVLQSVPYVLPGAILVTAALLFWHAAQWQKKHATT